MKKLSLCIFIMHFDSKLGKLFIQSQNILRVLCRYPGYLHGFFMLVAL